MITNKLDCPFGSLSANKLQRAVISATKKLPKNWLGRRILILLRKIVFSIAVNPIDLTVIGQRMRLYPTNNACEKRLIFTPHLFDPEELDYLDRLIQDPFVFLDIGANVGTYTIFAAKRANRDSRILAFEPHPVIRERLLFNISANGLKNIEVFDCAVSDGDGEIQFNMHEKNMGQSTIRSSRSHRNLKPLKVRTKSLLSIISEAEIDHINAIKIDVEGAEDIVLKPFLEQAPDRLWPDFVILEPNQNNWMTDIIAELGNRHYREIMNTGRNLIMARS